MNSVVQKNTEYTYSKLMYIEDSSFVLKRQNRTTTKAIYCNIIYIVKN
jgi:hypothetical protein